MSTKKKIEIEEISPFIQIKAVQRDWVGYDPVLLKKACQRGLELEAENKRFRDFSPKEARHQFWENWGTAGAVMLSALAIAAMAFLICVFVVWGVRSDKWEKGYAAGKMEMATAAITLVESQYRHVDQSQIRLEFPNGTDILNKSKWVDFNTGKFDNALDVAKRYDELVKNGGAYRIFISPKQ